ncbi:Mannose-1-phosphate guanylyltransferase [Paenibacillus curdlanolyticus YK9]|uniref:Mannose-1-phosphate guanylyltransferase n=1 Tax=Paenibacillus curdlanolyticus YK9 TaxID=717606 RepID=E0IFM4_9BACL|nr:sugar phosphate nucleotidyltransferase [Paenibacillus curdlanolyticus]EFM08690.1 Mannose-1-phosphate guanylyltransferase [Paenibacillus curdlanolyticus YK9]
MAGGKGTRFWPRSVQAIPKQFLSFGSGPTLIQQTYDRFRQLAAADQLFVVAPLAYMPLVYEQLPALLPEQAFIEPEQKDTAACMAYVAHRMLLRGDDRPIVFVPADQWIADEARFLEAIRHAAEAARTPRAIATLGITPTRPETGYGYIELALEEDSADDDAQSAHEAASDLLASRPARRVARFLEKPDAHKAVELLQQTHVYWNSGIFVWKPSSIAYHMAHAVPELWRQLSQFPDDIAAAYAEMPKLSIDYAVMEKASEIRCVPVDCGWDDIGTWAAFRRHFPMDAHGNVTQGSVHLYESEGNTVYSETETLLIGVQDLIVVSTPFGLLVCHRSEEPRLKHWLTTIAR